MYCKKCGIQFPDSNAYCPDCGTSVNSKPNETVSLLSMIFGISALGALLISATQGLSLPAAIAAVICGFIGKAREAGNGNASGNAQVGIICGFIAMGINVLLTILVFVLLFIYFAFVFGMYGTLTSMGMYM